MRALSLMGLAVPASAFLVVPDASVDTSSLPADVVDNWSRTLNLDCPGCPISMPHMDAAATGMSSHLQMNFEVDLDTGDRLLLNGFEIYPHANPFVGSLSAPHVVDMPDGSDMADMMTSVDSLGFTLMTKTLPSSATGDNFDHVRIDLQIIEVSDIFVGDIPAVHVELVKGADGVIAITSIETDGSDAAPVVVEEEEAKPKCESWLCSMIESLEDHWNHWRPHCSMGGHHGHHGHHNGTHHGGAHAHHGHDKPHHHGHHGEQPEDSEQSPVVSDQRNEHTWGQLMKSITTHILLPILIGIIAGATMSLIGVMVGTAIIWTYRKFRHGACPYRRVPEAEPATDADDEKSGLMDHQDAPPSYEEEGDALNDTKV